MEAVNDYANDTENAVVPYDDKFEAIRELIESVKIDGEIPEGIFDDIVYALRDLGEVPADIYDMLPEQYRIAVRVEHIPVIEIAGAVDAVGAVGAVGAVDAVDAVDDIIYGNVIDITNVEDAYEIIMELQKPSGGREKRCVGHHYKNTHRVNKYCEFCAPAKSIKIRPWNGVTANTYAIIIPNTDKNARYIRDINTNGVLCIGERKWKLTPKYAGVRGMHYAIPTLLTSKFNRNAIAADAAIKAAADLRLGKNTMVVSLSR